MFYGMRLGLYVFGEKSLNGRRSVFAEKFHHKAGAESGNDRAFPCALQPLEEQERQNDCHRNAADIKHDLYVAEFLVNGVGERFDKGLAGVQNDVCSNCQ